MKTIILSNSSYSYLWPIINDKLSNIDNVFICIESNNQNFVFNKNIKTIFYESDLNYTQRVKSILEKISDDYVILLHDIDIVLNFNSLLIEEYFKLVKENQIDRLSFGVYNNPSKTLNKNNVTICKLDQNISNNFYTPYDHTPSIYKRMSLIEIYSRFNNETYVSVEQNKELQIFVNENYKFYGIQKNVNVTLKYHRGFVFSNDFSFLHITLQGKFLPVNLYFDLIDDFQKILQNYNLNHIQFHDNNLFIPKNNL